MRRLRAGDLALPVHAVRHADVVVGRFRRDRDVSDGAQRTFEPQRRKLFTDLLIFDRNAEKSKSRCRSRHEVFALSWPFSLSKKYNFHYGILNLLLQLTPVQHARYLPRTLAYLQPFDIQQ